MRWQKGHAITNVDAQNSGLKNIWCLGISARGVQHQNTMRLAVG
ncbi:hypothetical protein TRICHSKD4_2972 [Roseibium sp. TrichSKD4]|nr:hypothetical protein TRICHSKD4_2972 [Roseibium sp. TrichSKD4]